MTQNIQNRTAEWVEPTPRPEISYEAKSAFDAKKAARLAEGFRRDEQMEQLLALRDSDPTQFATFGASTRTSVGYYELARTAAAVVAARNAAAEHTDEEEST